MLSIDELKALHPIFKNKKASVQQSKQVADIYRGFFRKEITACGCKSAYEDGIQEMISYMLRSDHLFELKPGAVLLYPANDVNDCNRHRLTDEKAIFHLRMYPEKISLFNRYPDNWKELVEQGIKKAKTEYEKMTIPQIKEALLKIAYVEADFEDKKKPDLIEMLIKG